MGDEVHARQNGEPRKLGKTHDTLLGSSMHDRVKSERRLQPRPFAGRQRRAHALHRRKCRDHPNRGCNADADNGGAGEKPRRLPGTPPCLAGRGNVTEFFDRKRHDTRYPKRITQSESNKTHCRRGRSKAHDAPNCALAGACRSIKRMTKYGNQFLYTGSKNIREQGGHRRNGTAAGKKAVKAFFPAQKSRYCEP